MAEAGSFDWRTYRLIACAFLALKLALLVFARPFMDETYYWLWGQHPALSYFDHPPLIGWTQALASALFGWNIVGLRIMVLITLIGDLALLYAMARHRSASAWREDFWPAAALLAATPIFFGLTNLALPDHLLIFAALLALFALQRFDTAHMAGAPRWRWLYLAAFAVGLAILSKYLGTLLALAILAAALALTRWRPLLRSPHFYLAIALVLAMQAPVLLWNAANGWASFGFIVGGRQPLGEGFSAEGLIGYLLGIPFVLSPFLIWPLVKALRSSDGDLARLLFWLSSLAFLVASLFTNILIHWNILAYVAMLPLLVLQLRPRLVVAAHFVYGALIAAVLAMNYTVQPVVALFGPTTDYSTSLSYGWEEVVPEIARLRAEHEIGFVAGVHYSTASALAFAMRDPNVVSLAAVRDAFDDWFDPAAHAGQDALIVTDRKRGLPRAVRRLFASVEREKRIDIMRNGYRIERYTIYLARGYTPPAP